MTVLIMKQLLACLYACDILLIKSLFKVVCLVLKDELPNFSVLSYLMFWVTNCDILSYPAVLRWVIWLCFAEWFDYAVLSDLTLLHWMIWLCCAEWSDLALLNDLILLCWVIWLCCAEWSDFAVTHAAYVLQEQYR